MNSSYKRMNMFKSLFANESFKGYTIPQNSGNSSRGWETKINPTFIFIFIQEFFTNCQNKSW